MDPLTPIAPILSLSGAMVEVGRSPVVRAVALQLIFFLVIQEGFAHLTANLYISLEPVLIDSK